MASKSKAKAKPASKKPAKAKAPPKIAAKPPVLFDRVKPPKPTRTIIAGQKPAKAAPKPKPPKAAFGAIQGAPEQPSGWLGGQATFDERAQPRRLVSQIKIGKRFRTDFSHVPALARDFNERGMLQPVVIDRDDNLVAGECRIKAWEHEDCKWRGTPLPVVVLPIEDLVAGEWAENNPELRKPFNPTEMVAIKRALEPKFKEAAKERQRTHKKGEAAGRAADAAAAFTGRDRRTVEKAEAVVEAAEQDPERFGKLAQDMDRTKRVDGPFKRLQNMLSGDRIKAEPPPPPMQGPYRTLVIDFPWPADLDGFRDQADRGYYPYATLSMEQIIAYAAEQVAPILHEEGAAVWLWIPNFHLVRGCHTAVLKALGVEGSTMLTWVKPEIGQGQRLRGATEHAILAVKGKVPVLGHEQRTWFDAPGGKAHSAKPQEFFRIVETVTPAPRYAFLFAGGSVPENWDGHGDRIGQQAEGDGATAEASSPADGQSAPPSADYPGDDEHKNEITELQAFETIEAGREIDIKLPIVTTLKGKKYARGSVKLKLTKLGMVQLEALRQEAYEAHDAPAPVVDPDAADGDGAQEEISQVDCRVCSAGDGICAQCMAAADHVVTQELHPGVVDEMVATCTCGFECRVEYAPDHGDVGAQRLTLDSAIRGHWQNVVTEANAAAASVDQPQEQASAPRAPAFEMPDLPASLRRAPVEAAE